MDTCKRSYFSNDLSLLEEVLKVCQKKHVDKYLEALIVRALGPRGTTSGATTSRATR